MSTETIDHCTLAEWVSEGTVDCAHAIAQLGGWSLSVTHQGLERPLAATRSKKVRTFRKLDSLVSYLHEMGIHHLEVDATQFEKIEIQTRTRPDQSEAMRKAHEAAEYDRWFRARVEKGLLQAEDPATEWLSNETVQANMQKQREVLETRLRKG
jgi:hypothetical protein